jgi:hypothetical protein
MRASKPGNSVYMNIGIWLNRETGAIHMTSSDVAGFHTTINADPKSKRGHPNLYKKLSKCLKAAGAPHPGFQSSSHVQTIASTPSVTTTPLPPARPGRCRPPKRLWASARRARTDSQDRMDRLKI